MAAAADAALPTPCLRLRGRPRRSLIRSSPTPCNQNDGDDDRVGVVVAVAAESGWALAYELEQERRLV
jgi:hypothetical protein